MRIKRILKLAFILFIIYVFFTILSIVLQHIMFRLRFTKEIDQQVKLKYSNREIHARHGESKNTNLETPVKVEVWGKAAISLYFWHHIFGEYFIAKNSALQEGGVTVNDVNLQFKYGGGLHLGTLETSAENVVLIANGREPGKVNVASLWIRHMATLPKLKNVFIILLGNEKCHNTWMFKLIKELGQSFDDKIKTIYFVYDAMEINNEKIMQWPLGVATYRGFPVYSMKDVDVDTRRQYTCNFLGTVYNASSRTVMYDNIVEHGLLGECYFKGRNQWLDKETIESASLYNEILMKSDLTLCPVGKNTECYRIYEAVSLGSVPVIEDVHASSECSKASSHPLQLLKKHKAPFIYVSSWDSLHDIIEAENRMSHQQKVQRRIDLLTWYANFKLSIRDDFLNDIKDKVV